MNILTVIVSVTYYLDLHNAIFFFYHGYNFSPSRVVSVL